MKPVKTTILSGVVAVFIIAAGFISTKIVAMVIGASGVAIIGAFANFISIILAFANGSISTGVVKYTAEFQKDQSK
ncbi:hypothetical protein [Sphingobacterium faecium]|uniref:hypothetical protein n=1 Tax=Sphingobacterium faecium TaxID=34087 RepID=UPI00247A95F0|nr:hypothetical protein [Sphingobacterium faecium]WGQ12753.1 hypothetical protein QG727_12010 [Sphingobacterium faecium]